MRRISASPPILCGNAASCVVRPNNPFLISNFKTWDVELGEDGFNYPIQKTYAVGLNISF